MLLLSAREQSKEGLPSMWQTVSTAAPSPKNARPRQGAGEESGDHALQSRAEELQGEAGTLEQDVPDSLVRCVDDEHVYAPEVGQA